MTFASWGEVFVLSTLQRLMKDVEDILTPFNSWRLWQR